MRKFTERYKLTAHSLKEIREGVKAATKRLADLDVTVDGHIIAQSNTINIAVLYYLKHPEAEQDRIGVELAPELEQHKKSLTPLPIEPLVPSTVGRKRVSHPTGHRIIKGGTVGENRVTTEDGVPGRRR